MNEVRFSIVVRCLFKNKVCCEWEAGEPAAQYPVQQLIGISAGSKARDPGSILAGGNFHRTTSYMVAKV